MREHQLRMHILLAYLLLADESHFSWDALLPIRIASTKKEMFEQKRHYFKHSAAARKTKADNTSASTSQKTAEVCASLITECSFNIMQKQKGTGTKHKFRLTKTSLFLYWRSFFPPLLILILDHIHLCPVF